jgi:hypothetical protein
LIDCQRIGAPVGESMNGPAPMIKNRFANQQELAPGIAIQRSFSLQSTVSQ